MRIDAEVRAQLARRFEVLLPQLNERQQRLALATEARLLGHGAICAVAEATGVSATTVRKGVAELESGEDSLPVGRARRAGGGRKRASEHDPELTTSLLGLVEPDERGVPMSPLRYSHYAGVKTLPPGSPGQARARVPYEAVARRRRPRPGSARGRSWFTVDFVGEAGGETVHTRVTGGDPGYIETAMMLAESALCLAFDDNPDVAGQVTTTQAMSANLLARVRTGGLRFEVL